MSEQSERQASPSDLRDRPFMQVDVFSATPLGGNPLAVVLDAEGLSTQTMQAFADWTNLSETTFLLPPDAPGADYRVRIFSPGRELPFAGHPTLGSCYAWQASGGRRQGEAWVQQCEAGLIRIRSTGDRLAFAAPPRVRSGPLDAADLEVIARGLGIARADIIAHAWCDNGPRWRAVMLKSAEQVLALTPDATVLAGLDLGVVGPRGKIGVLGRHAEGNSPLIEVRAFFSAGGALREDPVTGSLNAAIGQWLIESKLAPSRYVASQGTALGRAGRIHLECDETGQVWVGGACVSLVRGTVRL